MVITGSLNAQNVITVRKEIEQEPVNSPIGFYYSDSFTLATGSPGEPPQDFRKMFLYIDDNNRVYIFHSNKPVQKAHKQFLKKPEKYIEEEGAIEFTEYRLIYITTKTLNGPLITFKYVGDIIDEKTFYLDYKANAYSKSTLSIQLYRFCK